MSGRVGASINDGKKWMWQYISENKAETVGQIIDKGFRVDTAIQPTGIKGIHLAAAKDFPEVVAMLIEKRCDLNSKDSLGRSPLHISASMTKESTACLQLMIEGGAEVNA